MADTADGQRRAQKGRMSRFLANNRWRLLVGLVALVLAIIFIVENNEKVRIHFIFFTVNSRMWIGFLVSLVLGALFGQAFFSFRRMRHSRDNAPPREGRSAA